jgi:hypothetical protein
MIKLLLAMAIFPLPLMAQAQTFAPPAAPVPTSDGEIKRAAVSAVVIRTKSDSGPFTAFYIAASQGGNPEWFYVRNDDVAKSLERGAIIGLLMGAAQANSWVDDGPTRYVGIEYTTVNGRKEITSAWLPILRR